MSDPLISIRDLKKSYRTYNSVRERMWDIFIPPVFHKSQPAEFFALNGVSLDIYEGERVGFIGRNGAGKSTLLKLICGRGDPTSGSLSVRGKIQALLGLGVGFSSEWTGRKNIYAALSIQGMSTRQIKMYEEEIIDFSELEEFIDQPVRGYSAGMYTRLAFAVATCLEPEILIIDEVLGAGDAAFVSKSAARMRKLTQESGATVLFVSHSAASVVEICNRAVLLENGRIIADDDPLTVNKIYNKKVRAEEELSLRAREQRIRKRDLIMALGQGGGVTTARTLRLAAEPGIAPHQTHKIRKIEFFGSGGLLETVTVGGGADTDAASGAHVVHAHGMSNWSVPKEDSAGPFREFGPFGGSNQHAPFIVQTPNDADPEEFEIRLTGNWNSKEPLRIDIYDPEKNTYVSLRKLEQTATEYRFGFPLVEEAAEIEEAQDPLDESPDASADTGTSAIAAATLPEDETPPEDDAEARALSTYGDGTVTISKIAFLDADDEDRRVFTIGEKMRVKIDICVNSPIDRFSLVYCAYLRDGRQGTQVFVDSERLGQGPWQGKHSIDLTFDPLRLGEAQYMVSVGIFDEYTLTVERENASYCVMDRLYEFRVTQPDGLFKGLGAFAHKVTWGYDGQDIEYDPSLDHHDIS